MFEFELPEQAIEIKVAGSIPVTVQTGPLGCVVYYGNAHPMSMTASDAFALGESLLRMSMVAIRNRLVNACDPLPDPGFEFDGMKVCLTGQFKAGREAVEARLTREGAKISDRVDRQTVLIFGALPESGTDKLRYAERLHTAMISERELQAYWAYWDLQEASERY